jgi:hypothetical protein
MARAADEVIAVGVSYRDHRLTLTCPRCAARHVVVLPAVMVVVDVACPGCGHSDALGPAAIAAALDRLLPPLGRDGADAMNARVAATVRGWCARPDVRAALTHDGVDLAACGATELLPLVLDDVLAGDDA